VSELVSSETFSCESCRASYFAYREASTKSGTEPARQSWKQFDKFSV